VAATLETFAGNARWMGTSGGQAAFSLVLHTWSQDLGQHLHLHAVMACGVLGSDDQGASHWHHPARRADFLFPVRALSRVFRAKFMQALRDLANQGDAPADANLSAAGRQALHRHDWVVYAKTPLGGAAQVLSYLSRYSHRTAIGNERILAVSDEEVVFSVRADEQGGKRHMRLPITEFIRRFLLHVLPGGVQRIRHYGVLANGCKKTQLARARQALSQPPPNPRALESAQAFMARVARIEIDICPRCKGPLHVAATLAPRRHLPAPGCPVEATPPPQARAPP
jgi:hypothetical protein